MLEIYVDHDQGLSFAIFVIDEKACKQVLTQIKLNFGLTLEKTDEDDESFGDEGDFKNNTLLIKYKDMTDDFLEVSSKIHLHIIP